MKNKIFRRDQDEDFAEDLAPDQLSRRAENDELTALLNESFAPTSTRRPKSGDKVRGELLAIGDQELLFSIQSAGRPLDGVLPRKEIGPEMLASLTKGQSYDLYVVNPRSAMITLSTSPLARSHAEDLEEAYSTGTPIEGKVSEICKGGVRVMIKGKLAFCPVGGLDLAHIESVENYLGQRFDFLITEYSAGGRNIVVSRRKLLQQQRERGEQSFLQERQAGDLVRGTVKRLEPFGAFVEIAPGIEGLIHISEVSWSRLNHPSEALTIGQEVTTKFLKSERKENQLRISLSLKQAEAEPWSQVPQKWKVGDLVKGKVQRCLKFGAFVQLIPGVEGLVPLSEMSHTKRVLRSDELFKEGDEVMVVIKELDLTNKKLLLSLRDAGDDPWTLVPHKYPVGSVLRGRVTRKEPYGLFVELEEGITGLMPKPKSDSNEGAEFKIEKAKIGEEIAVQVLAIDGEQRRISLGIPSEAASEDWRSHANHHSSELKFKLKIKLPPSSR